MTTLYVDRKDIELRVANGTLLFHEPSGRSGSIPLAHLERVVLRGRAQLSTSVLGSITQAGAGVLMLSGRHNRHLATCVGKPHNDVLRRLGQFDAYREPTARMEWSRQLVQAKIHAQLRLLSKARDQRPDKRRPLTRAIGQLESAHLRLAENAKIKGIPSLLGIEGAAASAYFTALSELFPPSVNFKRRNRRPPRDPVNACLSLGYTLLHFEAVLACHVAGLDPMLGLFHEPVHGRESLAADVIEPLRPHIDEWVWTLFRERILTENNFRDDNGSVLLGKKGRQHFYQRFNPLAAGLRRLLRRHMNRAAQESQRRGSGITA